MIKSNALKNLQKIVKNSHKIALNIHPKNWPNSPSITKCTNSMRFTRKFKTIHSKQFIQKIHQKNWPNSPSITK